MARKRKPKQTEKPTVTLADLPRETVELTGEEAAAVRGGDTTLSPEQQAQIASPTFKDWGRFRL